MDGPRKFTPADYHKMSLAEKRAVSTAAVRETAIACQVCDTQVMPADLLGHLAKRCPGPRQPGPGSEWVTWPQAIALGVKGATLTRWVAKGLVRFNGGRQDRKYLKRDLVKQLAARVRFVVGNSTSGSEGA